MMSLMLIAKHNYLISTHHYQEGFNINTLSTSFRLFDIKHINNQTIRHLSNIFNSVMLILLK